MLKDCPNMKGRPSRLNMRLWVLSLVEGWHMFYETIFLFLSAIFFCDDLANKLGVILLVETPSNPLETVT